MFRKWTFGFIVFALAAVFTTVPTFHLKAYAENHSYDGKSPSYNNCDDSAVTKATATLATTSKTLGKIELRFSNTCKTAWARITLNSPVPDGWRANAEINRNTDGKRYTIGGKW